MPDPIAKHLEVLADALATPGEGLTHDAMCRRRKAEWDCPYICTCGLIARKALLSEQRDRPEVDHRLTRHGCHD